MCVSALKKLIKQLGRQACCDRALGLFRTGEEPRSIVQSRTIERRVLGDIGSQTILLCAPTRRQGRIDLDLRSMGTREALAQVRGALPIGPRRRGAGRPVGWGSQRIKLRGGSDDAGTRDAVGWSASESGLGQPGVVRHYQRGPHRWLVSQRGGLPAAPRIAQKTGQNTACGGRGWRLSHSFCMQY